MAVSHQWFVQWSAPPVLVADISSQYDRLDERWKDVPKWSDSLEQSKDDDRDSAYIVGNDTPKDYNYGHTSTSERLKNNDKSQVAGLTLWLAMLGVATPQSIHADLDTPPFSTLYKWKQIDFDFPSRRHREFALRTRKFVPHNVLPLGLEVFGSRIFVTIPAWRRGVPATLATVPRIGSLPSPALKPYPNWRFHRLFDPSNNCSGLTSVFRVNADTCGRLWVLDSGQIDSQDNPKQLCPPSVLVFDLYTDTLVGRYPIPQEYVLQGSLFANIIVDTRTPDCSDLHLYITDTWRFGLIVFREKDKTFWKFTHPYFFPDPLASNFTLHGINFQWTDGIFGIALSPLHPRLERSLYFHALSSHREFAVSTKILRDPSNVHNSSSYFHLLRDSRGYRGQASASAIDRRGVMYYGLVSRDSIGCWNTRTPHRLKYFGNVAESSETLVFPNDIKVDQEPQQHVWVISNRLPMFQTNALSPDDYNYRIMFADIIEAVQGSVCDPEMTLKYTRDVFGREWLP